VGGSHPRAAGFLLGCCLFAVLAPFATGPTSAAVVFVLGITCIVSCVSVAHALAQRERRLSSPRLRLDARVKRTDSAPRPSPPHGTRRLRLLGAEPPGSTAA
jgi:hypothetical protein